MKLFLISFVFLFAVQTIYPCSCMKTEPEPQAADLLKNVEVIFQGRVISIGPYVAHKLKNSKGKYYPGPTTYEVEFEVLKKWKGVETEKIKIETETLSCNTKFELNKEYLVLASGEKPSELNFCTRRYISLPDIEKEYGAGETLRQGQFSAENENFAGWLWNKIISFFS